MSQLLARLDTDERQQQRQHLRNLFSSDFLTAELNIYAYASHYLGGFDGAEWRYHALPCGGGFLAPDSASERFHDPAKGFSATVSGETAGIIITALVLNHRCWLYDRHDEEELSQFYGWRFEQLRHHAVMRPDGSLIFMALH